MSVGDDPVPSVPADEAADPPAAPLDPDLTAALIALYNQLVFMNLPAPADRFDPPYLERLCRDIGIADPYCWNRYR